VPSLAIETKACGSFTVPCGIPAAPVFASSPNAALIGRTRAARTRPQVEAMPCSRTRRLTFSMRTVIMSRPLRGLLDGRADALIGAAATDVAEHGRVDVVVRRIWRLFQEGRCLHDLAG